MYLGHILDNISDTQHRHCRSGDYVVGTDMCVRRSFGGRDAWSPRAERAFTAENAQECRRGRTFDAAMRDVD
jgi:hypothetical protein